MSAFRGDRRHMKSEKRKPKKRIKERRRLKREKKLKEKTGLP